MLLRALFLFSLTLAAYSFVLGSPFRSMDDQYSIVGNPLIKDMGSLPQLFQQGYFGDRSYYRPLTNVSFMAEYKMFGLEPMFYYLDNIFLHIANAFLVWALVACLVNVQVGFWVALVFAIHPIQWEAVSNISGRAILLSTFFSLGSFIAFLHQRRTAALLLFALALLCKESAMMLPGVLALHSLVNRQSLRFMWPWAGVAAVYLAVRQVLGITEFFRYAHWHDAFLAFLTFLKSVLIDVRLLLLPLNLYFDRSLKTFGSAGEPEAMMTLAVYVLAGILLLLLRRKISPLQWLCLGWFALCLLPVSQLVTSIGVQPGYISTAEHFLYLACVPVFCVVVQWLWPLRSFVMKAGVGVVIVFFFLMTVAQNLYASNEVAMLKRSLGMQPHNARLHSSIGLVYALNGNFREAESHFAIAVVEDPGNSRYRISLGKSVCDQGRFQDCLAIYDQVKDPGAFAGLLRENRQAAINGLQHLKP